MREINSDAIKYGINAEHVRLADDRYRRCRRCGFIIHRDRDASQNSDKKDYSKTDTSQTIYEGGPSYEENVIYNDPVSYYEPHTIRDPIVSDGCPQCGLLLLGG